MTTTADHRLRPGSSRTAPGRRGIAGMALAATIAATALAACGGGEEEERVSDPLGRQLQQVVDDAVRNPETTFPGTALHVSHPELGTWSGAAGEGRLEPATPMQPADAFRAGSIVKPFISTTILQLVEEGKISLDDPLSQVVPGDVAARFAGADRITVRMLLNHTSGIPEYADDEFDAMVAADPRHVWTVDEFLDRAAAQPPTGAPGERYAYSNTNYNLAGLVIEQATGRPWREAVRERIIDRLDLEHTSLPEPGRAAVARDAAHGYERVNGELIDLSEVDPSMADAAGGHALRTTTEDLSTFLHALLAGELFEHPGTLGEMLTFVEATDSPGKVGHGLGIERYVVPGGVEVIGHAGRTAGYFAFVGRLPAQDVDLAMAITSPDDPMPVIMPAVELMVAEASSNGSGSA